MGASAEVLDAVGIYKEASDRAFADPAWFFNNILKFPLLPWQLKAVDVVFDVRRKHLGLPTKYNHEGKPRLTIRSCHGTGKTQFLAGLMHIWNFVNYGKIACTAPKEAQLTKRLLPRYRACMKAADQSYKDNIDVTGKEISVFGDKDWGAIMETASDPDNLAGYHDKPQLFLVDEASARRLDAMFPVIEGALTTPGSVVVEIGNPTRIEGEFHAHHTKAGTKELYYRMHIKHTDAPEFVTPEWVNAMAIKYGVESPVYLIRVSGEFAAFDKYILIPPEFIDDAMDIEEVPDGSTVRLRVAVDVSDGGADASCITCARMYDSFTQILKQRAFYFDPSISIIETAKAAITMFDGFNGNKATDEFVVDAIGVGAGVAGYLMDKGYNVVRNVGGETKGVDPRFRNRRVQNYIAMYEAFATGAVRITPDAIDDVEEFIAHMLSVKRATNTERVDDIEPKHKIKQDTGDSPDRADSPSMLFNNVHVAMGVPMIKPELVGHSVVSQYDSGMSL